METGNPRRVRSFVKSASAARLLKHLGEPVADSSVVTAKDANAAMKAFQSRTWLDLLNRVMNHQIAQVVARCGDEWYQKNYDATCDSINKELQPLLKIFDSAWRRNKLPTELGVDGWIKVTRYVHGYFEAIALAYAFEEIITESFACTYLKPWLLKGHLPCGWKGTLPKEPRPRLYKNPYEGIRLSKVIGDGQLMVL